MKKDTNIFNILKSNRLYALEKPVETWLNVPGKVHTFWKDAEGTYLGINDTTARHALNLTGKEIIGWNDEILANKIATLNKTYKYQEIAAQHIQWTNDDKTVFNTGKTLLFYNYVIGLNKCTLFLSQKTPLSDINNRIVGTFGLCFYLSEKKLSSFQNSLELQNYITNFNNQAHHNIPTRIILKNTKLSTRETECAFYLTKGFTLKQIANRLKISDRTVDSHLGHIKDKLNCHNNNDLVTLLFDCGIF